MTWLQSTPGGDNSDEAITSRRTTNTASTLRPLQYVGARNCCGNR